MFSSISNRIRHFFHVISNVRPIFWICLYVALTPIFAIIYWGLPDGQFRIPDGATTDYGSWLYYSIVTITTLGFGDYTPAGVWAQCITAVEVMCGLIFLGFFLNAVGSMKSEIDIASEIEKQRKLHYVSEKDKLTKNAPAILRSISTFLAYCYAATTPVARRNDDDSDYNPDFTFNDMRDLYEPSGLPIDRSNQPVVTRLIRSASQTSLVLDSMQMKIDLSLWPDILEDCFGFVAGFQMFSATDALLADAPADDTADRTKDENIGKEIGAWTGALDFKSEPGLQPYGELYAFIKENADYALKLQSAITTALAAPIPDEV